MRAHYKSNCKPLFISGHFSDTDSLATCGRWFYSVYPNKADVLNVFKDIDQELSIEDPLYAVAYDENKTGGFLHIEELDAVSTQRPILVSNLVFHRFWANSALLRKAGISENDLPPGVESDESGKPNGTLIEAKGLMAVLPALPDLVNITEKKSRTFCHCLPREGTPRSAMPRWGHLDFRSPFIFNISVFT